jgi:membrane protein implicated in regulation of membrane protease activity
MRTSSDIIAKGACMATTLRAFAFACYAIAAALLLWLLRDFVKSCITWDWDPWWWFPAGFYVLVALFAAGGTFGMASEKSCRKK